MPTHKAQKKKLVLLDAHAIIHRAYHALPDFTAPSGEPTGALYGLSAMLLKLVKDLRPDYMVACYDLPEPTYRHEVYEAYKAGRAKTDNELSEQLNASRDIFTVFAIPIYEHAGFEADDIIGTIVEQTKKHARLDVVIASGDMDTLQLVDKKRVVVYTLRKGLSDTITYDETAVKERFGFGPKRLPDYKGLRGDPSDNIIGISGIGEKTATTLITQFGSLEDIYKTLKKDTAAFEQAGVKKRIINLLNEHEEEAVFSKMLATIRRDAPIAFALPKEEWESSLNPNAVLEHFSKLGFRTLSSRIRATFSPRPSEADEIERAPEEDKKPVTEANLKKMALAVWLLRSETTNPTSEEILQFAGTADFEKAESFIFKKLQEEKLESVYKDIELPLLPVVEQMNEHGILLDRTYLKKLSSKYHKELSKIEKRIFKAAGEDFNINSPRQLADVLFDKLGLAPRNQKRTATGHRSTRESELEKLKGTHAIIDDILSYRELQKLLSTYIDNLPNMVDGTGRLHATFVQSGTTTGRMSSQNPNLQNIPIKTELGRTIRNGFIAANGYEFVALDYSQIELRIAAVLSGDKKLIEIFKKGGDIHQAAAADVFDVPPEMVDAEMRRRAKVINFGILYGMGVNALRESLGTNRKEAQRFLDEYFKQYAGLARYLSDTKADAERTGYTTTLFGRRRYIEGIRSHVPQIKAAAERVAVNAPIQGTQADIIKIAMVRVDAYLTKEGLENDARLLLQVHDELVYEIRKNNMRDIAARIQAIMESVVSLKETAGVPMKADASHGSNWGEMKPL